MAMSREEAINFMDLYESAIEQFNSYLNNQDEVQYLRSVLLAALTQEPNQPKGEGEHTLLTKVYLSTNNVACHSYEVKTFPGGISLGLSDYITGHWEPITEKN